jgi:two-component system, NarL family, sensor kinase
MRLFCSIILIMCHGLLRPQTEADSLRLQIHQAPDDTTRLKRMMDLAYFYEFDNRDSAIALYNQCFALAHVINNDLYRGRSLQFRSIVMHDMGRYAESIVGNNKALVYFERIGFEKGIASTHNNIGNSYLYLADYHNALKYYLLAKPYYTDQNDFLSLVTINGNMGECYRQLAEKERMLEVARESNRFARLTGDSTEIANAYISLGSALSLNGFQDSSLYYLQNAMDIAEQVRNDQVLFYALFDLADAFLRNNRAEQGLELAQRALAISIGLEDFYKQSGAYLLLGKIMTELPGKETEAFDHLQKGWRKSVEIEADDQRLLIMDALSMYYEKNNDLNQALRFKKAWIALNDSIFNREKSRQIGELHTLYELEEKEKEIADERLISQGKDEKIRVRNFQILVAIVVIALAIVLAWLIWKTQRNKRRLAEQESTILQQANEALIREQNALQLKSLLEGQEKERTRLARELHDGLGGYLTSVQLKAQQLKTSNLDLRLLDEVTDMVATAGKEMRKISHALAPEGLLHLGLAESINQYVQKVSTGTCSIAFEVHGQPWAADDYSEHTVYRIIQELINNVLKHADAHEAFVSLSYLDKELHVVVEDNGKGFDTRQLNTQGHGLQHIQARVTYLNGDLDILSQPGKGSSFTLIVPQNYGKN